MFEEDISWISPHPSWGYMEQGAVGCPKTLTNHRHNQQDDEAAAANNISLLIILSR
jgi:hypothetical protein